MKINDSNIQNQTDSDTSKPSTIPNFAPNMMISSANILKTNNVNLNLKSDK